MVRQKNKQRNREGAATMEAARGALDNGRPDVALALIAQISGFYVENLITLMGVLALHASDSINGIAYTLFTQHLSRCSQSRELVHAVLWARNPKRCASLPEAVRSLMDDRRRELEPEWNGVWENLGSQDWVNAMRYSTMRPEEAYNIATCITAAKNALGNDVLPWLQRYANLGGNTKHPAYLTVYLSHVVFLQTPPSEHIKKTLRLYTTVGDISKVRKFLRNITDPLYNRSGVKVHQSLSRYALLLYCGCDRLDHNIHDWTHIAKSALSFGHGVIQRIALRALVTMERTQQAQEVFDRLTAIHGTLRVTDNAKVDVGLVPITNSIWHSVYLQLPIDADARRIMISYARYETNNG